MDKSQYNVEQLVTLLGLERFDSLLNEFIEQFKKETIITIDQEDGADDEYVEFRKRGFCLYFEHSTLQAIFLYSSIQDPDFFEYGKSLPLGLQFSNTVDEVQKFLGKPDYQGGGHDGYFGLVPVWLKYVMPDYALHVKFHHKTKQIQLVTLLKLE